MDKRTSAAVESGPLPQPAIERTTAAGQVPPSEVNTAHPVTADRSSAETSEPAATIPAVGFRDASGGPWTNMRANTWVNVRQTTGGRSAVLGVINPDEEVLLGPSRGGWRRVRSDRVSGWVDSRLFRP
ncbi:MAG: hypothetical protein ACT4OZ_16785 [Gemmatimonadota bacterium]